MKSATYFAEIIDHKAEKYLHGIHLVAHLLALFQLRNFFAGVY